MNLIDNHVRLYLQRLGFKHYYHHIIHGPADRLHWGNKNDFNTIDAIFNTRSGHIWIDKNVKIGHNVMFLTGLHTFENGILTNNVPDSGNDIVIGDGCWIASGVIIIGGVTLGANCRVAAGSVVTNSFPAGSNIKGDKAR